MFKSIFSKESLKIFKDRKLIVAIIAVIFVPILYAGMFLWAFWDPYDLLEDIPVAIVNEDEGHYYEGDFITVGNELVDNLKDNPEFDFHFVGKNEGYQGLEKQDYYILIEIPKNFSKNATTVMDDPPEQLELIYVPNESYNFLASQMGETAMLQIEKALEEEVIKTYAETIFDKIDKVADGLVEASDATEELNDGANELEEGSSTLDDHLNTLAEKTVEFSKGVNTAYDGSGDLAEGTNTLSLGVLELYDNSIKLRQASENLQSGANQLNDGISDLDAGVSEVYSGLTTFHNELPKEMSKEITNIVLKQKDPLRKELNRLVNQKKKEFNPIIKNKLIKDITNVANGAADEANQLINNIPKSVSTEIAKAITEAIEEAVNQEKNNDKAEITAILNNAEVQDETIQQVESKIEESSLALDYEWIEKVIQKTIETTLNKMLPDVPITQDHVDKIVAKIEQEVVVPGIDNTLDLAVKEVDSALDNYENMLINNLDNITASVEKQVKQALNEPVGLLKDGVNQLAAGTNQLHNGSQQLASGHFDYVDNMYQFTSSFSQANDGAYELNSGANELNSGMTELNDASIQLSDGAHELSDGSGELHDGILTLVDGTEEFNEEMHEASKEASDVSATEDTHQMISDPVEVENEKINKVPNYGTGFTPYFLSLGLFVGALLLSIVYPLKEPSVVPTSGTNWFLRKFIGLFTVGVLQALIASGILLLGLGIEVQSIPLFILYALITSLTFITLIQFFVTCFDDPGRFMAIIILILQLTTSAGTFPLELIPKVLQPINTILPMTYSVAGFKAVVSSGDYAVMWQNAGILLGFSFIFMTLTWLYFRMIFKRKYGSFNEGEGVVE